MTLRSCTLRRDMRLAALGDTIASPDPAVAKRAFAAMMTMTKIDIATIEAAIRG